MSVTRVDILVVVAAIGVVVFVTLLPSPRDNNPAVPDTTEHRGLQSERDCLRCHAAGAPQALPARHPSRTDCFRCHRIWESNLSKPGKLGKLGRAHVRTVALGLRSTLYDEKPKRRRGAILWRHSTGSMRCCSYNQAACQAATTSRGKAPQAFATQSYAEEARAW